MLISDKVMEKSARHGAFCRLTHRRRFTVVQCWYFDNFERFGRQYWTENSDKVKSPPKKSGKRSIV